MDVGVANGICNIQFPFNTGNINNFKSSYFEIYNRFWKLPEPEFIALVVKTYTHFHRVFAKLN